MIIDSHQHFWHYDPDQYPWIEDGMDVLMRDYTAAELAAEIDGIVDGVVTVQARTDLEETQWLLDEAAETSFICGVVGWVPLADPDVESHLERLSAHPTLVGVRHPLQDESDEYMLRDDFNRGVALLDGYGLTYDLLIREHQMANAIEFVDRHPNLTIILDHAAKPRIADGELEPWRSNLKALAQREHCRCKLSGLVTEADWASWTEEDLAPYVETVLEAFGPERVMFGSDWPVCLLAADYGRWYHTLAELVVALSPAEKLWLWGRTARTVYGLD